MKNTFCTLFDQSYLVKGLALYSSMKKCIPDFRLYVLAMDEQTETALKQLESDVITVISLQDVINEKQKSVLNNRLGPSLFWTCTPLVIEHVLIDHKEEWCTYIDADCYFFDDPSSVFDLIEEKGCCVGIVEHRFKKDGSYDDHIRSDGRFNVAFNVFRNNKDSLKILREWRDQCIEQCTNKPIEGYFGDQLYLNEWPDRYTGIYIIENEGIDVAPWNVNNYSVTRTNGMYRIVGKNTDTNIIMYHFHTLNYVSKHIVSLNLWNTTKRRKTKELFRLYRDYIDECNEQQVFASKYVRKTEKIPNEGVGKKIRLLYSKYKNRKENGLIQIFRNMMWV